MSDMSPYHRPSHLTAGARFIRGFRRIGLALAVVTLVVGLISTVWSAIYQWGDLRARYEQASCIVTMVSQKRQLKMDSYWKDRVDLAGSGCYGPMSYSRSFDEIWDLAQKPPGKFDGITEPLTIGLPATLGLAAFFYFVFWGIGWLFAGFTRD